MASSISLKPTLSPAITGVDPGTGEYMSKSDRIAQFRKTRISRDKVFGNNNTSSALAKITPTQSALPDAGGALVKKPDDSGSGGGRDVWKEISNIRKSVETLQETVKKISDSLLEQKKDKDDAEKKKKRTLLLAGEKEKADKK